MELKEYLVTRKNEIKDIDVRPRKIEVKPNKNFILSIIGPRRAGKTYFLYFFIKKNGLSDEKFCFVNFEEVFEIKDATKIPFLHNEIYGVFPQYLFFDEIQALKNWEKVIYHLYEKKKYFIFITGSSSKLLSREIATQLRGRAVSSYVYPFSFNEILEIKGIEKDIFNLYKVSKIKNLLEKHIKIGCFPDIVLENITPFTFFREYLDLLIFKDIMERYGIRKRYELEFFIRNVISAFSKDFSVNKVYNIFKSKNIKTSKTSLYNFQKILEDIRFAFFLKKYGPSLRKIELAAEKVYVIDNGFPVFSEGKIEIGRLMENFVFLELLRSGLEANRDIFFFKDYQQREVDFVIKQGSKVKELIQVTYANEKDEIEKREIKSLLKASRLLRCKNLLVITWDYEGEEKYKERKIKFLPLWKWLLLD
ncbi:MAG: AAA family ATPase [Thermoplasmata archaeon]|nr:MAG: AAA family ATPase [Thermoplasmata archaeon]